MQRDCKTYVLHFEQVWSTAEFILGNCEIQRLICGNCAPDLAVLKEKTYLTHLFQVASTQAEVSTKF